MKPSKPSKKPPSRKILLAGKPASKSGSALSQAEKDRIQALFQPLIEKWKETALEEPHPDWNYRTDLYSKWYRNYFYLCSRNESQSPNRLADAFEDKFTRLEYVGPNRFNLAYYRHTDQWWTIYEGLNLEECLRSVEEDPMFQPV